MISVEVLSNNIVNLFHALFLSVCVGAVATPVSTYLLLGIDFVANIHHTLGIIIKKKRGQLKEAAEDLQVRNLLLFPCCPNVIL